MYNQYDKAMQKSRTHTNTIAVATKINREAHAVLKAIAEKHGLKIYNLLQVVIDAYIRYLGKGQSITEETETLVNAFANIQAAKDSFTMCGNERKQKAVNACIAFVKQEGKPEPQPLLIYAKKDGKGNTATYESMESDAMLKTYLRTIDKDAIKELARIKEENGLLSLTDALKYAIHEQAAPEQYDMMADIEELFADNSRAENGKVFSFEDCASQYVRHNNKQLAYM